MSTYIASKSVTFLSEARHQSLQRYSFTLENPDATKLKRSRGINWWPCLTDQNKSGRQVAPFAKSSDPQLQPYGLHSVPGRVRLPAPSPATRQLPALPPAFALALQAPKRAQGQLVSTRQTGNLALPPPFGQLVDRQNGLLRSWEMLGCRRPPPAQTETECDGPKLPWNAAPFCSTYGPLSAPVLPLVRGTEELFGCGVMRLFILYSWKDLEPKALIFSVRHLASNSSFFLVAGHRLPELKVKV